MVVSCDRSALVFQLRVALDDDVWASVWMTLAFHVVPYASDGNSPKLHPLRSCYYLAAASCGPSTSLPFFSYRDHIDTSLPNISHSEIQKFRCCIQ